MNSFLKTLLFPLSITKGLQSKSTCLFTVWLVSSEITWITKCQLLVWRSIYSLVLNGYVQYRGHSRFCIHNLFGIPHWSELTPISSFLNHAHCPLYCKGLIPVYSCLASNVFFFVFSTKIIFLTPKFKPLTTFILTQSEACFQCFLCTKLRKYFRKSYIYKQKCILPFILMDYSKWIILLRITVELLDVFMQVRDRSFQEARRKNISFLKKIHRS